MNVDYYLRQVSAAVDAMDRDEIEGVAALLLEAWRTGATVYALGNGGSAALASHMACDLAKNTSPDLGTGPGQSAARRLRVVALTDNTALVTALGNDIDYADVFVEQLKTMAQPGDIVLAISGSGTSPNVLRALEYARVAGATTIGFTGSRSSAAAMVQRVDHAVRVPTEMMEQIEDLHVIVNHVLAVMLRARIAEAADGRI